MVSKSDHFPSPTIHTEADVLIHVIGPNRLQNELLTAFLRKVLNLPCLYSDVRQISELPDQRAKTSLILLDCFQINDLKVWSGFLPGRYFEETLNIRIALFNVTPEYTLERMAMDQGACGVFHLADPLDRIAKGVQDILSGELWYSRKTMSRFLVEKQQTNMLSTATPVLLTQREKEILIAIAAGAGNKEIADDLRISLYTVKTHIYNIYKKIKVPNRLQAAFWAARYLTSISIQ